MKRPGSTTVTGPDPDAGTDPAGSGSSQPRPATPEPDRTDEARTDEAGTDEAGTDEAGTDEAGTDEAGRGGTGGARWLAAPGAGVLALMAVTWLAAMLWAAQRSISFSGAHSMAITTTALALPGVICASLVGGAAVGLAAAGLLARRGMFRPTPRFAAAVGGGLLTGVLAALAVSLGYGSGSAGMLLAGTAAAAATLGGIAGGLRTAPVPGSLLAASLATFVVTFVLELFRDPMLSLYGMGDTAASQVTASQWTARTTSLCAGLVAGVTAFGYLRLARRREVARGNSLTAPRWPVYLLAGAGPGLLLLVAEVITNTAGAPLIAAAGGLSDADRTVQSLLGGARVNHALLVLFIGALTAIIVLGRTLRPADEITPERSEEPAPPGGQSRVSSSEASYHSSS